jgi:N-acetylmuramoyl-L-alanine amidase
VSKIAVVVLCSALAWLAGCASDEPTPPDWSAAGQALQPTNQAAFKPIPGLVPTNAVPVVSTNAVAGLKTNLPALVTTKSPGLPRMNLPPFVNTNFAPALNVLPKPRIPPVYTWTSLKRWALERKVEPPLLLSKSPLVTYSVSSARGVMVLAIGIREAAWNGVTLHLGFAPEIIDGDVYVHGLDLQKSFEPFLCDAAPVFGTNRVIVIDPGHGGINAGTVGVGNHRPEKEFTLDWARRIQPLLEQEGWQVVLTRTNDVDIALSNRVTMAENRHADVFLSLHFNAAPPDPRFNSTTPDPKPAGLATFCLTPVGMPSTVTRGYPDILFQGYPNNSFDTQNVQLAERLQRSLLHATGMDDRGVNRARFIGVLRGQRRPSVLIEAGFMSNPHEFRRIESADFRQKLAEAVAAAFK